MPYNLVKGAQGTEGQWQSTKLDIRWRHWRQRSDDVCDSAHSFATKLTTVPSATGEEHAAAIREVLSVCTTGKTANEIRNCLASRYPTLKTSDINSQLYRMEKERRFETTRSQKYAAKVVVMCAIDLSDKSA